MVWPAVVSLFVVGLFDETQAVEVSGKAASVREYTWRFDSSAGIIATVPLDRGVFPGGIPGKLNMRLRLPDSIANDWEILRIDGFVNYRKPKKMDPEPSLDQDDQNLADRVAVLRDLNNQESYFFEVYLHLKQPKCRRHIRANAKEIIRKFQITYFYKKTP